MGSFDALVRRIVEEVLRSHRLRVVGIGGGQGAGKSTLARMLVTEFEHRAVRVAALALDDFYLPRADRARLASDVHPLLITRGVPGTHDVAALIAAIQHALEPGIVSVPRFDKASDDRLATPRRVEGGCRVVVVEGWCLGARPQPPSALVEPVNDLEREEDSDGVWRRWVNERLVAYEELTRLVDYLVFLDVGDLRRVHAFRAQQERDLPADRQMDGGALIRFIAHYERLTRWMADDLPSRADLTVVLGDDHRVESIAARRSSSVQPDPPKVPPDC